MYKIKEIFKSIQGEGYNSGKTSVFVRFTGCNLWNGKNKDKKNAVCNFCDTDFIGTDGKNGGIYNIEKLVDTIEKVWNSTFSLQDKFVILTGGEPLLQVDDRLVKNLQRKNFMVAVETNGTINTMINFDWVCVSPKDPRNWKLKKGDELKIIYPQRIFDLKKLLRFNFKYFFLQPKYDNFTRINLNKTLNYCKRNREWFPSLQLHKIIRID